MSRVTRPSKKADDELWPLINERISNAQYVFVKHAEIRKAERSISDLSIIHILERTIGARTKRNKRKDKYEPTFKEWNYCIEGQDNDNNKIRVIVSFNRSLLLIVTVMKI